MSGVSVKYSLPPLRDEKGLFYLFSLWQTIEWWLLFAYFLERFTYLNTHVPCGKFIFEYLTVGQEK